MVEFIEESGMNFIVDNSFYIEKSPLYAELNAGKNKIRTVEFIRYLNNDYFEETLLFVEAKTTFPNPNNPLAENLERFDKAICEICKKFTHSLSVCSSILTGANNETSAEPLIKVLSPPKNIVVFFVLVIKTHEISWCKKVHGEIMDKLPEDIKHIWRPEILVINHETAIEIKLAADIGNE